MKTFILVEIVITVLAGVVFLIQFLAGHSGTDASDHPGVRAARRHLIAATAVAVGEGIGLSLLGVGVAVPLWLLAIAYGTGAAVMIHRNVLRFKAQRSTRNRL